MEKILEKLEEYNIFNYLLPGIIFTYLLKYYIGIDIFQSNAFEMFFIFYFIGSIISRIGSILLENILIMNKFIKYAPYKEYVDATEKDSKIEKLLVFNNLYRTLCTMFILALFLKLVKFLISYFGFLESYIYIIGIVSLSILYLFSYKKQTEYIVSRVERIKNK